MLKNEYKMDGHQMILMVIVAGVLMNDYFDFAKRDVGRIILKIIITIGIVLLVTYLYRDKKVKFENLIDQIRTEKKGLKKFKKTLSNFDTRVLSHVKASPASFAKIITNDLLY
jgi:hypothetical protein